MNIDELYIAQKVFNELVDRGYIKESTREDLAGALGSIELGDYEGLEEDTGEDND